MLAKEGCQHQSAQLRCLTDELTVLSTCDTPLSTEEVLRMTEPEEVLRMTELPTTSDPPGGGPGPAILLLRC
jgi:hypothetical protein